MSDDNEYRTLTEDLIEDSAGDAPDKAKKAAAGEETAERDELISLNRRGLALIHSLFSASKMVQIYKLDNNAVKRVLSELMDNLGSYFAEGSRAAVRLAAEYININDVRIKADSQYFSAFQFLMDEMKKKEVESIEFNEGVMPDEIANFLKTFYELEDGDYPYDRLEKKLAALELPHISISQYVAMERRLRDYNQERKNIKIESNRIFFRTVALMKEVVQAIEERHVIKVRKAKRLTQQMVDIMQTDESILLGLASIKNFDEYTFAHSVNVCILSMAVGDKLRLCKGDIARLGLAALFHDIGKVYIPESIINNPNELKGKDWELMKYHTFFGIKELSKVKALREMADAMFVSLQHHVHYDLNGYPRKNTAWRLRLFSRIVTISDYYDAMTSPRVYRPIPLRQDKVMRFIFQKSGEIFDPFLAKVFIRTMGLYPVGTGVELDTKETGIVVKPNHDTRFLHRPCVKLITPGGPAGGDGSVVDLTEKCAESRKFRRSIIRSIDCSALLAEQSADFLLKE